MEDPRRLAIGPTSVSIVEGAERVSISDSPLTVAGGHVNHVAVNISVNNQPSPAPISRSLFSRILGGWLVGTQTIPLLPLVEVSPPVLENTSPNSADAPTLSSISRTSSAAHSEFTRSIDIVRSYLRSGIQSQALLLKHRYLWIIWTYMVYLPSAQRQFECPMISTSAICTLEGMATPAPILSPGVNLSRLVI